MTALYPMRFEPIWRRYPWGGRKLATLLAKPIGKEETCAESWEVVDHGDDQSVVAHGPLAGTTLNGLVDQHGAELFGFHNPQKRFPLLFKFLDAHQTLSVQVHPDDQRARLFTPPENGKTEAWVVLAAEPGSLIYAGLKRGVDRAMLAREVERGTCELCLARFEPRVGDCVLLPAGTIHALGGGLVVAEIQQTSDTTYRLFDWSRLGTDGRPRELHVDAALDAIDYTRGPIGPQTPRNTERPGVQRLIDCESFVLDRWQLQGSATLEGNDKFHLLAVINGSIKVSGDPAGESLTKGATVLIPAAMSTTKITTTGQAEFLDVYLP